MDNGKPEVVVRQVQMVKLVPRQPAKITVGALCAKLENLDMPVTRRTVERDLLKFSKQFGLINDGAKPAGWSVSRDALPVIPPALTRADALTCLMVEQYLEPLLPRGLLKELRPRFDEARRVLDDGKFRRWKNRVVVLQGAPQRLQVAIPEEVVEVVHAALLDGVQIRVDYRPIDRPKGRYTLNPLALVNRDGVAYLVATRDDSDFVLQLAMHRMKDPERLETPSREPAGFDLRRYIEDERGFDWPVGKEIALKLRLNPFVARYLEERPLSREQSLVPVKGEEVLRLTASVRDTMHLRWWLLSYGTGVEVLGPASLRRWMRDKTEAMAASYRSAGNRARRVRRPPRKRGAG
ncbi:MAG: helix-turn-helix transcriptional regulator [Rhodanobacteraceae bacterium]